MTMLTDQAPVAALRLRPRNDAALLPPAIILLVFAMVVIAVGGFAYITSQQQALATLRSQSDVLRGAARYGR